MGKGEGSLPTPPVWHLQAAPQAGPALQSLDSLVEIMSLPAAIIPSAEPIFLN